MTPEQRRSWLAERRGRPGTDTEGTITATDVACLVGVGFVPARQIYFDKIHPPAIEPMPHPLLRMGLMTEPINHQLYAERYPNYEIVAPGFMRHAEHPWMGATLDRLRSDHRVVELKYTPFFDGEKWGEEHTDEIPFGYIVQTQWQMHVSGSRYHQAGVPLADVAALAGTGEQRVYTARFDAALTAMLVQVARDFREQFILTREEPPVDYRHPFSAELEALAEAVTFGKAVDLGEDGARAAAEYDEFRAIEKEAKGKKDEKRAELLRLMGDAEKGKAGGFNLSRSLIAGKQIESYWREGYPKLDVRKSKGGSKPKKEVAIHA